VTMPNYRAVCLLMTLTAGVALATAQTSSGRSSAKSDPDSVKASTKALTPKSAMPAPRKSTAAMPKPAKTNGNTAAELTRLEQQPIKAGGSQSGNVGAGKRSATSRTAGASSSKGSGINFNYQKPASASRATPRSAK
jgi:hypothetical protein